MIYDGINTWHCIYAWTNDGDIRIYPLPHNAGGQGPDPGS